MNPNTGWILTLIGIACSVLLHAGIAVFYYGRMAERVMNHSSWLKELAATVNDHESRISRLEGGAGEERLARLERQTS